MHIIQIISNKEWGEGEKYAFDLSKRLLQDGSKVSVVNRKTSEQVIEKFSAGGIEPVKMTLGGALDVISPIRLSKLIDQACREDEKVVLHVHNFKDATLAIKARKLAEAGSRAKIVCTRHIIAPAKADATHSELYREIDRIVFTSEAARTEFLTTARGLDAEKTRVVHPGIAPHPTLPAENRDPKRAIFAGRITPESGLDILVTALSKMQNKQLRLSVCGSGRGRDVMPIVRLARALDVDKRIDWLGQVEDVEAEAARCSIAIDPSSAQDTFGLSILEFMMEGMAVVATNSGTRPELIRNGEDGILIAPPYPEAMAEALDRLIDHPEDTEKIAQEAHKSATERFGYEDFYRKITGIYKE